jgi:hypothetical protein
MRENIKGKIPAPVWKIGRSLYFAAIHGVKWPAAYLHPWRRKSINFLNKYKNKHKGERCFIIGNGPSLNMTDVSKLKNEHCFGMNRIYLAFPDWVFETSYFVSINDLVIEQCADEIAQLQMPKFLAWHSHPYISMAEEMAFLHTTYTGPVFQQDARKRIWEGATVTNVAIQLAFYMGFEKVILIGVDHNFKSKGDANKTITSEGDDENHFSAEYFGKGFRWQLPDLETSEVAYQMARKAYENAGREVIDATIGGKLDIFKKVEFDSLF